MLKFENGVIVDLTEEEEASIRAAIDDYKKQELQRPLEPYEVYDMMVKKMVNTVEIDDETSLRMKTYYPAFEEIIGQQVEIGFKLTYKDELWKVRQAHTIQEQYPPSVDTASLYERIDEAHTGTIDDLVPYDSTMQVYNGIYYSYEGKLYICIRDSGQPLYANPGDLIDNYFQLVTTEEE